MSNFENPIILDTLAHAYSHNGDWERALTTARRALAAADNQSPAIHRALEKTVADFSAATEQALIE